MSKLKSIGVPPSLLLFALLFNGPAQADPPPDLPLPPCTEVDGVKQGACPATSPDVSGSASGRFTAGGSVVIETIPTNGVCVHHNGYSPYPWTPSPCYAAIASPSVVTCAVIDLLDGGRFRELPCSQALYKDSKDTPAPLLSLIGPDGLAGCGARGNFQTYANGGPANVPGARWSEFGPAELQCTAKFNGKRPDGLYGPTWIKMRVGIDQAQTGDVRRGYSRSSDFYVPIDGDMRELTVDIDVLATSVLKGDPGEETVTLTATITNEGPKEADNVEVTFSLPQQLHFVSASDGRCEHDKNFVGGPVVCFISLAGRNDEMGNDVEIIDVVARIVNAADLKKDVRIFARVANDIDTSNNEDSTTVRPTLLSGSFADTSQAMEALAPYFNYEAPAALLDQQCNIYMDDIFARLEAIRGQAPEAFENLSYAKITSGDYYWAPVEIDLTRAGHVGVVVYKKGTNYHQTGIVIHGTPTSSPADRDEETRLGLMAPGAHRLLTLADEGTSDHGLYYRTPISNFPGSPAPDGALGCGFEGLYAANADEFERDPDCNRPAPQSGPFYPNATVISTESPVDILVVNSQGQRVETRGGEVFVQELDSGIHSFASPHEDGTFAWTLVLPKDDYDIQLLGTGEGPYKLKLKTFDEEGNATETVYEGTTTSGQIHDYELDDAPAQDPGGNDGGNDGGNNGGDTGNGGNGGNNGGVTPGEPSKPSRGGGGAGSLGLFGFVALLALMRRRMSAAPR